MEYISTRQAAARVRVGTLPNQVKLGEGHVRCACHPNAKMKAMTESIVGFWQKGMKIHCAKRNKWVPALAVFPKLGIVIDTRK